MMPPGYTLLRRGAVRVLLRNDVVTRLGPWLVAPIMRVPDGAQAIASGRGGAFRARCAQDLRVVVRPCRRGGWLGRVIARTYLGWRPRPWRELAVSLEARARAVPTPAILAVRVVGWGLYRGVVVTEEVPEAVTLAEALRETGDGALRAAFARAAGEAVARLHGAGVEHADLNLGNILVLPERADGPAQVIDLDKARVRGAPLAAAARRRNLRRLERSWCQLMAGAVVAPEVRRGFQAGYAAVDGAQCEC
jgi:3-deoxy-D-manno-octulosonic acid kinase